MHSLLRSAAAAAIILGLSAGAAPDARADVAHDSFGNWFDAVVSGDHSGDRSRGVNRCADPYAGCNNNNGRSQGAAATDRGGRAGEGPGSTSGRDGGGSGTGGSATTGGGGNTGGGGDTGGGGNTGGGGYNGHGNNGHGNNGHGNNVGGSDPSNPGKGHGGRNDAKGDGRADHESPGHQGAKKGTASKRGG